MNRAQRRALQRDHARRHLVASNRRQVAHDAHLDCGCSHLVVRACDGVCDQCHGTYSWTMPPMPSSQGMGESTEVGMSCHRPGCTGEVVGRGVVIELR